MNKVVLVLVASLALTGCSSWRYRGFVDEPMQVSATSAKNAYRLNSVVFEDLKMDMAVGDNELTQALGNFVYAPYFRQLGNFDTRKGGSYVRDIAAEAPGFLTTDSDATAIDVCLTPHREETRGFLSFLFPLTITLGIVPSNKSRDIPFDIRVSFPDTGAVRTSAAVVRIDSRFALSPLGASVYPTMAGTEACETMADYLVFDSRNDLLRKAFVKTVASAVKRAIAEREGLGLERHVSVEYEKDESAAAFKPTEARAVREDPIIPVEEKSKSKEPPQDEFFSSR